MNLRSSHLANHGRRIAGFAFAEGAQAPDREARGLPAPVGRTRVGEAEGPALALPSAGHRFELTLSDDVQMILLLAAKAANVSPAEIVARAIPFYASEAIGLPALLSGGHGDLTAAPERPDTGRGAANRFLQGGEEASCLVHTQEIAGASPAPATRFRSGGP